MLVVSLVSILAALATTAFSVQIKRAKRAEALLGLKALWDAQILYLGEHQVFASSFNDLPTFQVQGGRAVSSTEYQGPRYNYQLSQPWGSTSFYAIAVAQLDTDPWPDVIELSEQR